VATNRTASEEKPTTLTLLIGMSMAAIKGVRCPVTANVRVMALYKNDIKKPVFNITDDDLAKDSS
jgi:hypothetical protein